MATQKTETPAASTIDIFSVDPKSPEFAALLASYNKQILDSVKTWEKEQVGFPPYWKPKSPGDLFLAKVILKDERDPSFPRYIMQATKFPIVAQQGPAEDADVTIVSPGDYFTTSVWAGLPLDDFMDIEACIMAVKKRKLPGNEASDGVKRDLWVWEVKATPESRKLIASRRAETRKLIMDERKKANELEAVNA